MGLSFCFFCLTEAELVPLITKTNDMSTIKIPHNGLPQEIADDIMRSIQTHKDLMYMEKFDKERTDKNIKGYKWKERSLEWAQDYFKSSFDLGDGERNKRVFVIKNSLGEIDRDKFQTWLNREYPRHMSKWKKNHIVRRGN